MSRSIRVLHVDDDEGFAETAAAFVEQAENGLTVETASSARKALDRLESTDFDCVVSDYEMPGIDGIEFLAAVRKRHGELPFVLFTGKGSEEIASEAITAGATDYLRKDTGTDQYTVLANRIENSVQGYRASRELERSEARYRSMTDDVLDSSEVATVIVDADRTVAWVNETVERYFGLDSDSLVGADVDTFAGAIADVVDRPSDAADRLLAAYRANPSVDSFECRVSAGSDRAERWLEHRGTPIETGIYAGGRVEHYTDVTELKRRERRLERIEEYRGRIQRVITDTDAPIDERIERVLDLGCELLGAENGHVVEIDRRSGRHEVRYARGSDIVTAGTVSDLSETLCRRTLEVDGVLDLHEAGDDPIGDAYGIERYVGAKILVEGGLFGTLCFVDRTPSDPISEPEKTFVDLTSRWISHALERESARREREEIFDRMTDGVFALDDEWRFSYLNERGLELINDATGEDRSAEELLGRNIWDEIPEAVGTTFYERYHEAMDSQASVTFELFYQPLETWFEVRVYPSENGISVYFLDVTDERNRESKIRNREAILREVYDVVSDTGRGFDEQIGELLDIGRRVVGTEYASLSRVRDEEYIFEVVRAPDGTIEAGDVVDLSATNCERAIATEKSLVLADVAAEAPELTEKPGYADWGVSCYVGSPVYLDGNVYGTFCFYDEMPRETPFSEWQVTLVDLMARWISYGLERRRIERRLRRQNDRLDEFASVLSHDLRNPLSVARGHLELLEDDVSPERLDPVRNAHERIEALISDVLTMAREGATVEETDPVSLGELATASWGHVETGPAELIVTEDVRIEADSDRLGRLFENLFRNSVEHGSTGSRTGSDDSVSHGSTATDRTADEDSETPPTVTVRVGRLRDGFFIEDDGPGVPESERSRVFEYGYSTREEGTGFGLGIVREIAEAHGWELTLTESDAGGARFEITGVDVG